MGNILIFGMRFDCNIILSFEFKTLSEKEYYLQHFKSIKGQTLLYSSKYHPKKEFLEFYLDVIFDKF